jgi:phage-related tail protein
MAAPGGLFGDTDQDLFDKPEKGETKMSQDTLDLPVSRSQRSTPAPVAASAAGDSDVARLVRELERRLAQVETRLDEANDARERLERQVAAQSEELRVQRAAIARTQRALRGLNRGEEEQATEPALRDPGRPMGGN